MSLLSFNIVLATEQGNVEKVRRLLVSPLQVDSVDMDGRTLLHVAVRHGRKNIAEYLLSKNANVNARERFIGGLTPLHEAICCHQSLSLIKFLLDNGATVDAKDDEGLTPLYRACMFLNYDLNVIKLLIERGASLNVQDKRGRMPIHWASLQRNLFLMQLLLDQGVPIDAEDGDGSTPLLHAVKKNKLESISFLLHHGANTQRVSKNNESPLSCAIEMNFSDSLYLMIRGNPETWNQLSKLTLKGKRQRLTL